MALPAYDCTKTFPAAGLGNVGVTGDPVKGCVWLNNAVDGHRAAIWYPGYWARFAPVRIYDSHGKQVWSELDRPREIGGGWVNDDHNIKRIPKQCRVGNYAWLVNPLSEYEW